MRVGVREVSDSRQVLTWALLANDDPLKVHNHSVRQPRSVDASFKARQLSLGILMRKVRVSLYSKSTAHPRGEAMRKSADEAMQ